MAFSKNLAVILAAMMLVTGSQAFCPPEIATSIRPTTTKLMAGGFEWEDPTEQFDQGVENPYKNPELMNGEEGMKVDPARLLGPRLSGTNLYFVGMMGCGKSSVGDVVARSKKTLNWKLLEVLKTCMCLIKSLSCDTQRNGNVQLFGHG